MLIKMKPISKGKHQKTPKQQPHMKLQNNLLFKEVYPEKFMWGVLVSTLLTSFLMWVFIITEGINMHWLVFHWPTQVYIIYLLFIDSTNLIAFMKADYIALFLILLIPSKTLSHTVKNPTSLITKEVPLQRYIYQNQDHF